MTQRTYCPLLLLISVLLISVAAQSEDIGSRDTIIVP